MRLDEFVDKWLRGARRITANPKHAYDLSWVTPGATYEAPTAAARMGVANVSMINAACRSGAIAGARRGSDGRVWLFTAEALLAWRQQVPEHTRFDIRARLAGMRIRQLNEKTGDIQWSRVVSACESGEKDVYQVTAGDFVVAGSADHRVLTSKGWKAIGSLERGDLLVVRKFGKRDSDKADPMRLKKIDGMWRSQWQREERQRLLAESPLCRRCSVNPGVEIHHIEPVCKNPARAFDPTNVTLLCDACHNAMHVQQDWQGKKYLYGALAPVTAIMLRGTEMTYDLEIAGDFPNFLANGVVVHNSRNSASSRAIPSERLISAIMTDPFIPQWTAANKGMVAAGPLDEDAAREATADCLAARDYILAYVARQVARGVSKQDANRYLEPWMYTTIVATACERAWRWFFGLRDDGAADPKFAYPAKLMHDAFNDSMPRILDDGDWHLPYIDGGDIGAARRDYGYVEVPTLDGLLPDARAAVQRTLALMSAARCARISYLRQHEARNIHDEVKRAGELVRLRHWSPTEHQAQALSGSLGKLGGNLGPGWLQHRHIIGDGFAELPTSLYGKVNEVYRAACLAASDGSDNQTGGGGA
jgi:hypothetical protein